MSRVLKTVTVLSFCTLLAACSVSNDSKRQVSGGEKYLKASELTTLNAPSGIVLPRQYSDFMIPNIATQGEVGKALDIRPPLQPLGLLPASRTTARGDQAEIRFDNPSVNVVTLVQNVITAKNFTIASGSGGRWTTDWVTWNRRDESSPYRARYDISAVGGDTSLIHVKLLELQQRDRAVTTPAEITRYAVIMLNTLVEGVYEQTENPA